MAKRLIVCCDGTWNSRNTGRPTNVEKIAQAIAPRGADGTAQVVFYDQGVGTSFGLERWLGGALGIGLSKNIEDAYRFLVDNYAEGDEIFFFGFSRGAYTARSTVGLIRKCDLLTKRNSHRFAEAYSIYRERKGGADTALAVAFRERFSTPVRVRFLGVWDTVGALGVPGHLGGTLLGRAINRSAEFHDVKISSKVVGAAYQALAIDEERAAFEPAIWWREHTPGQALEQAWFPGWHSDVGGGSVSREQARQQGALSDIALDWMVGKARTHELAFDDGYLRAAVHPDPLAPLHPQRRGIFRLTRRSARRLLRLPDDPALRALIERRRRESPHEDPVRRPPAIESPQEIHESAWARVRGDASYRPPQLMEHARRG